MTNELRTRALLVALLLVAWTGLVYLKSVLPEFVLTDLNALIEYVKVMLGGIVGFHVGKGKT
jgi:hypothetical protein